jgi:hypothetical protein
VPAAAALAREKKQMAADERRLTQMKTHILSAFISVYRRLIAISSQILRER